MTLHAECVGYELAFRQAGQSEMPYDLSEFTAIVTTRLSAGDQDLQRTMVEIFGLVESAMRRAVD